MSHQTDLYKKAAAEKAVEYIKDDMIVGLGTGSTTVFAIRKLGELIENGTLKRIRAIPSSLQSETEARKLGIDIITFEEESSIDITIDGADEVDDDLNLIKGGGGALLREKVLAQNSKSLIIIVDEFKLSQKLGEKWHVPVEVIPFAEKVEEKYLRSLGAETKIRYKDGIKFLTDNSNIIIDANFGVIEDPDEICGALERRAGISAHGIFLNLTDRLIIGGKEGIIIKERLK